MSMLNSHTSVRGCGLFVAKSSSHQPLLGGEGVDESFSDEYSVGDSEISKARSKEAIEVIELCVREISTPHHGRAGAAPGRRQSLNANYDGGIPDYAKGMLEVREPSEYGHQLAAMVTTMLTVGNDGGKHSRADSDVGGAATGLLAHRIIKLKKHQHGHVHHNDNLLLGGIQFVSHQQQLGHAVRAHSPEQEDEEIWLVPVKTAREVFGVVRITLAVPAHSASSSLETPRSTRSRSHDNDMLDSDEAETSRVRTPRKGAHASSLRPAVEVAQDISIHFAEMLAPLLNAAVVIESSRDLVQTAKLATNNKSATLRQANEELVIVNECTDLLAKGFAAVTRISANVVSSNTSEEAVLSPGRTATASAKLIARSLSAELHADVTVDIRHEEGHEAGEGDHHSHHHHEKHAHHQASTASDHSVYKHRLVDSNGAVVGDFALRGNEKLLGFLHGKGAAAAIISASHHHMGNTGETLIKSLIVLIANAISSTHVESDARQKVELAARTLQVLEAALEEKSVQCNELVATENLLQRSTDFYRTLADILNQSLTFVAKTNHRHKHKVGIHGSPDEHEDEDIGAAAELLLVPSLGSYLQDLCDKLPTLIGGKCIVAFAVSDQSSDMNRRQSTVRTGDYDLQWHTATKNSMELHQNTRNVAVNMAKAVITTGEKSAIDVSNTNNSTLASTTALASSMFQWQSVQEDVGAVNAVKILTWPLLVPVASSSLQNILNSLDNHVGPTASPPTHRVLGVLQLLIPANADVNDLDGFCQDVASAAACAVSLHAEWTAVNTSITTLERYIVLSESSRDVEDRDKVTVSQRLAQWELLSQVLCELCSRANILATTQSEEKESITRPYIVQLMESPHLGELLAKLGFTFNSSIGIENNAVALSAVGDNDNDVVKTDLLRMLNAACNSILSAQSFNVNRVNEASQKAAQVQRKNEKVKAELVQCQSRLAEELHKRESLIRQLSEYNNVQLPTVYDSAVATAESLLASIGDELSPLIASGGMHDAGSGTDSNRLFKILLHRTHGLLSRLTDQRLPYHLSILVETGASGAEDDDADNNESGKSRRKVSIAGPKTVNFKVFSIATSSAASRLSNMFASQSLDNVPAELVAVVINPAAVRASSSTADSIFGVSGLEQCLVASSVIEESIVNHATSLAGVSKSSLHEVFGRPQQALQEVPAVSGLFVPIDNATGARAIIRVLYKPIEPGASSERLDESVMESKASELAVSGKFLSSSVIRSALQIVAVVAHQAIKIVRLRDEVLESETFAVAGASKHNAENALLKQQLQRAQRICKVVSREASVLLDSPVVNNSSNVDNNASAASSSASALHPASLPPAVASQDITLKILSMVRSLLRSESQALLLKDLTTDPHSYQILCSGSALSWPGIEQGVFGVVNMPVQSDSAMHNSLVETVMRSHKVLLINDPQRDSRYHPALDGHCSPHSPLILCPIRGRGGAVVGVVIAAKGQDAGPFTVEDAAALELTGAFGSLSLYWCQGLGSLHNKLMRSASKMSQIENAVDELRRTK
jgi:hypothetical protein